MIDKKKLLAGGAAVVALSSFAMTEAKAAGQVMSMTAKILAPITMSSEVALNFGNVTQDGAAGAIKLNAIDGLRAQVSAGLNLAGGTVTRGIAKIGAPETTNLTLSITGNATVKTTATGVASTKKMLIDNWSLAIENSKGWTKDSNDSIGADATLASVQLETAGPATGKIWIGADLTATATQVTGEYNGTFTVTAEYN